MYDWLTRITITCFAASYLVTLVLEVSRLFFRAPVRLAVMLAFAVAGIFAHTSHLFVEARKAVAADAIPLSRWYDWSLLAALVLAVTYVVLAFQRLRRVTGLFLLPIILGLIALASFFFGHTGYPTDKSQALFRWGVVHGVALLLGSAIVMLGFVAGIMYLLQSHRLKMKLPPQAGLKLPSLEWLQRVNRKSLLYSSFFIAAGLLAGIVLNLIKEKVPWTEPLVVTSSVLLLWLIAASAFEYFYKPARQGRKVAYLTIASFIFLGLVIGIEIFSPSALHGVAP